LPSSIVGLARKFQRESAREKVGGCGVIWYFSILLPFFFSSLYSRIRAPEGRPSWAAVHTFSLSPLQNIPTPGVLPGNTKEGGVVYVVDHAGQEREKRRTKKKEKNDGAFVVK